VLYEDDWCGEHPERQPKVECAEATFVRHDAESPAADLCQVVNALVKITNRVARTKP
jgi:D-aminopeptidase